MNNDKWTLFNMEEILNFVVDSHQLINVNIIFNSFFLDIFYNIPIVLINSYI